MQQQTARNTPVSFFVSSGCLALVFGYLGLLYLVSQASVAVAFVLYALTAAAHNSRAFSCLMAQADELVADCNLPFDRVANPLLRPC